MTGVSDHGVGTGVRSGEEHVVLLDELGRSVGTALKSEVHHTRTPLHLAFSCYVFDSEGRTLMTRRAATKPTWPGVWTNGFCGHPQPGEGVVEAVRRRGRDELGLQLYDVRLVLPRFRYHATMADGTTEKEICPVFAARTDDVPRAAPDEVAAVRWLTWKEFELVIRGMAEAEVSPWCLAQVAEFAHRHDTPPYLRRADWLELPPALLS